MRCEDVDELRLLGGAPGAAAAAHARGCGRCRAAEAPLASVRAALAAAPLPAVSGGLTARVLAAAAPALARNAALAARRRLAHALAAGLLPLPLILLFDVWLVRSTYALLTRFLPDALGLWVVVNWAGLLALLLALAYGAIPFLAARQTAALRLRSP